MHVALIWKYSIVKLNINDQGQIKINQDQIKNMISFNVSKVAFFTHS